MPPRQLAIGLLANLVLSLQASSNLIDEPRLLDRLSRTDQPAFQMLALSHVGCNCAATCCTNSDRESCSRSSLIRSIRSCLPPSAAIGQQAAAQFGSNALTLGQAISEAIPAASSIGGDRIDTP